MRRATNAPWVSAMSPPDETVPSGAGADRGAAAGRAPGAPCRRTSRRSGIDEPRWARPRRRPAAAPP